MLSTNLINTIIEEELTSIEKSNVVVKFYHGSEYKWVMDFDNNDLLEVDTSDKQLYINLFNPFVSDSSYSEVINDFISYYVTLGYKLQLRSFDELQAVKRALDDEREKEKEYASGEAIEGNLSDEYLDEVLEFNKK